jgi:glycosyltransferase involved in cell wall biosynthesis
MSAPGLEARQAGATAAIGVVFETDPRDPRAWSGVPASLSAALGAVGATVEHISVQPPRVVYPLTRDVLALLRLRRTRQADLGTTVEFSRLVADISPEMAAVRTRVLARRLRRLPRLDGLVQIGSNVSPPPSASPFVTFEDMTIAQVTQHPYAGWAALSPDSLDRRRRRQSRLFHRARTCCVASPWAARSVISDYGVAPGKVHVVGMGRNHELGRGSRDWREPRFLFVGLDWERKNGEGVLRGFARLRRRNPAVRLDVVSRHPPIDVDGVTGHGPLDRPSERATYEGLFGTATCFVMPSHYEPFGIVHAEAAAAGIPSIGTSVGGASFVIGEGGRAVDPGDDEALFAALAELSEPDVARRLGAVAEERSALFTWRAVAERVLRALSPPGVATDGLARFL